MKLNKKLIILSIVGLVLIGIIGGVSFAYFSTSNQQGEENTVKSGTMALLFTDGQQVAATNLAPGEYIEKTFKVKNTGNIDTRYDVYFSEVLNTFVDQSDLVYTLTSSDGGYNTTSEVQVPNTESKIVNQQLISPNEEHTYTLRITFKLKQTIQNVNMGRTFTAKININEFNLNSGEHFLKLIDASGSVVDKQILATNKTDYTLALNNTDLTNSTNIYCNNGGIPTINGNTLNVTGITNDTVCTISNDIVDTINNKLTTTKTGIVMTNDQNNVATMTVPLSKEVVYDLNGKEVKSTGVDVTSTNYNSDHIVFSIPGKLTINDSVGTGGLYNGADARLIGVDGELIINNGNFSSRNDVVAFSHANVEINGGNFSSAAFVELAIEDNCTDCIITVNDGNFVQASGKANGIIYSNTRYIDGKILINNGSFVSDGNIIGTTSLNKGTVEVRNGTFNSTGQTINNNGGNIIIHDGYYKSTNDSTIYNIANMTIHDGTIENSGGHAIWNFTNGDLTINNGNFTSDKYTVLWERGNNSHVTINGGYFKGQEWATLNVTRCTNCGFDINGGTIDAAINNGYDIIMYTPDNTGVVTINGGTLNANNSMGNIMLQYAPNVDNSGVDMLNGKVNINGGNFNALDRVLYHTNEGVVNICNMNLVNGKTIQSSGRGYVYYKSNAFGSVTPTYSGTASYFQVNNDISCSNN